jgi:hypothetical protein
MPFGYRIGDHCAFVLDIPLESLFGENPVKIVHPASRRLKSRLPGGSKEYVRSLESNIIQHHLLERLHNTHIGHYTPEERAWKVIAIDEGLIIYAAF